MKQVNPFPERARFLWAFILNRWAHNRRRTRVLPADYVPIVSVVIPALNEAENLPYVLPLIPTWIDEVILVDGYSHDGTVEVARQLLPEVRVVQQSRRGKGDALRSGFAAATGDIIVMLDADGSTDPREIPDYVGAWSGVDAFGGGTGTLTMTITATTMHWVIVGGSYDGSTADASLVVDETLKHMTLTFTMVSGAIMPLIPLGTMYTTYSATGTTLQMAQGVTALPFPLTATGGLTLTKL